MGCNTALYLTLHETGLERWGWWGACGTGVPGPGAPGLGLPGRLGQGSDGQGGEGGTVEQGAREPGVRLLWPSSRDSGDGGGWSATLLAVPRPP